jgi:DNA relaxase NicK
MPYRHLVNLNGGTLSAVTFDKLIDLLGYCQTEEEFIANRIDIALDFNPGDPRLSARNWESFLEDNLLSGYRLVRRVSNCGRTRTNRPGATVYLGSRESERFIRIYDKVIEGKHYDRLEIELSVPALSGLCRRLLNLQCRRFLDF